jgi:alpha-tubulin suppressor-like RCC1 family protein
MRLGGWLVAAGTMVGCYSPSLPEDQPCSETGKCPGGLTCDLATGTCVSQTPEAARFTTISAAFGHACGIDPDGALFCWGDGVFGRLGTGDITGRLEPTRVGTESDWRVVTAGENNTCGIRADASLWCWGVDLTGANNDDLFPVQVPGSYSLVDAGDDGYCAVETDGTTQCRFQTSNMLARQDLPAVVSLPTQIAYTHSTMCVIDDKAALYCWGNDQFSQLGDANNMNLPETAPHHISGSWKSIALGAEHACAVATDGALSCWGDCGFGPTGNTTNCEIVTRVGLDTYKSVAAGLFHTCAIRDDGAMVCFGENPSGELGSNGTVGGATPRVNADFNDWTQVIAGERFTCALRANRRRGAGARTCTASSAMAAASTSSIRSPSTPGRGPRSTSAITPRAASEPTARCGAGAPTHSVRSATEACSSAATPCRSAPIATGSRSHRGRATRAGSDHRARCSAGATTRMASSATAACSRASLPCASVRTRTGPRSRYPTRTAAA